MSAAPEQPDTLPCPACGGSGKVEAEVCCNSGEEECCGGFVPGEAVCMRCRGTGRIKKPDQDSVVRT